MPGTSTSYSRIADRYEAVRGGAARASQLAAALLPWMPVNATILDAGAGTGVVSGEFCRDGRTVIGVDLSPEMIRQATQRLAGRVAVADVTALPVADASIDAVTFVWVLHLVGDPAAALREAARVLRPGGRAVVLWAHPAPPPPDEATEVHRIMRELDGLRTTTDPAPAVIAAAEAAGLHRIAVETVTLLHHSSPADTAAALEQRLFSWLWDVGAQTWQAQVQPRIDELRSLPDADRRDSYRNRHPLWIYERPLAAAPAAPAAAPAAAEVRENEVKTRF